ncbi:MAG: DUF1549 and DUF1553 domain-containing protein, partial [Planctomycetota bacterium]|nr:DUF1549 and DUF1553 domain-containing protein [Planctomycetota bacterium]
MLWIVLLGLPTGAAAQVAQGERPWWSFAPLQSAQPPEVARAGWCANPIDRFVLAELEERGLRPSESAERATLVRRLFFDVIGLPPTPDEVRAFVDDDSEDAYGRLVDRLLASPHFGERWARHWLDAARFAESHGFEQDYDRPHAYHYRDFVTRAFNADLPYDQFVRWQLAGDELAPDDPEALMATGFLAAGAFPTQLTENEFERARYDELDDMVGTMGTAMLGLTISCARCHDHKYDPISADDYYRLVSTFTTTIRSNVDVELDPERTRLARERWTTEHLPLTRALEDFEREVLPGRLQRWLAQLPRTERGARPAWTPIALDTLRSEGGATFEDLGDGSVLATGTSPANDRWTLQVRLEAETISAFRLEALAHDSLVRGGPGRATNGNFALSVFEVRARGADGGSRPLTIARARSTFDQVSLPVSAAVDDDALSAWAVDPQFGRDHAALLVLAEPLRGPCDLEFELQFNNNVHHSIGRPRLSYSDQPDPRLTSASELGTWLSLGPFVAEDGKAAFDKAFPPEAELDLSGRHGDLTWRERPEFMDGVAHELEGELAATYLHRSIDAPSARQLRFAVGSDDAIKVWLNGELIHENWVLRGVRVGQDEVTCSLRAGRNDLLLKVVNQAGGYGFAFGDVRETSASGLPIEIAELLGAPEQLAPAQEQILVDWFAGQDAEWRALDERVAAHLALEPAPRTIKVLVASENVKPIPHHADGRGFPHFYTATHFLDRGDPSRKGEVATQGFLQALMSEPRAEAIWQVAAPDGASTSFRRASLANWIVDTERGAGQLLARVIVNRLWQHLHGRGIVATPNDFGVQGTPPTHPELLDWLAQRLVDEGWRLKPVLKLILESSTYRQRASSDLAGSDPENLWLARRQVRRLEAEIIRDAMLSVAGLLDPTLFGPGTLDTSMKRRSLYFFQKRSQLVSPLQLFDAPQLLVSIGERPSTTIAPQALLLMNSPLAREAARGFARRVSQQPTEDAVERAYWLAFGRAPSPDEAGAAQVFLDGQTR